jgi:DNA-binding NtrC family response regulator
MSLAPGFLRVLIVDDVRPIADSLSLILQARGYRARAAYSAEEAIVTSDDFAPNVLISDVIMPGMNGVDLAACLGERHPQCKVLLISGNAVGFDLIAGVSRRGSDHTILSKPIHPARILQFLAACAHAGASHGTQDVAGISS